MKMCKSSFQPVRPNSQKIIVPLSVGLSWGESPDHIYQEKVDGEFCIQILSLEKLPLVIAGENVRATGEFHAFDLLEIRGENLRNLPLGCRLVLLDSLFGSPFALLPSHFRRVHESPHGGNLLQTVLARGGEGIVRKRLNSPWGTVMEACKRLETFLCIVTGFNAGQSVQIGLISHRDTETPSSYPASSLSLCSPSGGNVVAKPCGNVALRGGKCDRVRVGSIIKVEGFGLTAAGQIREPRPCKDTATSWLIKY